MAETGDATSDAYAMGERIRAYRAARQVSLRRLAQSAGVSPGFLSQVERGRANVSIGRLRQIASALGVTVADLFADHEVTVHRLVRRADRPSLPTGPLARKYLLSQRPLRYFEAYLGEFDAGGSTGDGQYVHGDAQELFYVMAGRVTLSLGDEVIELEAGDSVEYSTSTPHRAANAGDELASVLWLVAPPTLD